VIKPLQGRGRVNGDASVTRPLQGSNRAVVLSQALFPSYSDLDPYNMAACAIDTAIRNAVAAGASVDRLALLDNFCWCSSGEPGRLGQLKKAVSACYDYAVEYGTPFISGKDSMFNDFSGFDSAGKPIKISVPPTLLVSSIGVMEDCRKAVSIDAKVAGDLVYILGETRAEMGGSEYYAWFGEQVRGSRFSGTVVPKVDAERNLSLYRSLEKAIRAGLTASTISIHRGGLGYALARTAMAGKLGMDIELSGLIGEQVRDDFALFSESQGRVVATVAPANRAAFEDAMKGNACYLAGTVRADDRFVVKGRAGGVVVDGCVADMLASYRSTLGGF